jgi:hypothetical protein
MTKKRRTKVRDVLSGNHKNGFVAVLFGLTKLTEFVLAISLQRRSLSDLQFPVV